MSDREKKIAEIREWHEGKRNSFPQFTVFEAVGVMLDEIDRLKEERDKMIEGLRWYADEQNHDGSEFRLSEIEKDEGQRARNILREIGVTVDVTGGDGE